MLDEKTLYLIRKMPFRDELLTWCEKHPNFAQALKAVHDDYFVGFNGINLSNPPLHPKDQVIGMVVYDLKRQFLKQDFIVDKNFNHTEFTLFTKLPKKFKNLYGPGVVQDINDFYQIYGGEGKYYSNTHYPEIQSLHPELQERINRYVTITHRQLLSPPK